MNSKLNWWLAKKGNRMCNGVKCACKACEHNRKNNPKGKCNGCSNCGTSDNKQRCVVFGI